MACSGFMKTGVWGAVALLLVAAGGTCGAEFAVRHDHGGEYHYYIFDFGDGTETPTTLVEESYTGYAAHEFAAPGSYAVRARSISMSGSRSGWKTVSNHTARSVSAPPPVLHPASSVSGNGGRIETLRTLRFRSGEAYPFAHAGVLFPGTRRIDELRLLPVEGASFPSELRVQYCMDRGRTWHTVPRYDLGPYPDPEGRTVILPMHGLAAQGVRILCPRLPGGRAALELEVRGGSRLPFECDGGEAFNAALNNLWLVYGSSANEIHLKGDPWWESRRPLAGGVLAFPVAEWSEWAALQVSWTGLHKERERLGRVLRDTKMDPDGFVWASEADPRHLFHTRHAVNNPTYILALHRYHSWTAEPDFWGREDANTGETILHKARRAMRHCLEDLRGEEGLLVITYPGNDGTAEGHASNYWDGWRFGWKSAYANIFFHASLRAMADIERWNGNDEAAARCEALAATVRKRAGELFWDDEKGRFIGWIDKDGRRHDYGFTFVNIPAIAYGLATPEQSKRIMSWLTGERIIEGDTAKGADLYHWRFAAVPNTVDAGAGDPPYYWEDWGGQLTVGPGGSVPYGGNVQNGGAIFYLSYYDLMARLHQRGPDAALRFFKQILAEFEKDELRRDPASLKNGMAGILGVIGPFPESGNVPMFYLYGLMGLDPSPEALRVRPRLPSGWDRAAAGGIHYAGRRCRIICDRGAEEVEILRRDDGSLRITVPADRVTNIRREKMLP
ncbi:glycosyl hydrolase family 65 protein [Kiritimatiella glycovorans]|uniref:Glycoside hydrolase family 65 C-terminal domain-containing protein n=1 Tax=Kiritimatiella glycovorans TaxID=1307763 RepID=A0A0G3ELE8_9BACT|nr:glycosyl hydrolase family 65 protein [Kiritimatiella glycovorans]AKJ65600.1 hypothetical protein L21SP4_02374 [Kiritimatiella glycovorans]